MTEAARLSLMHTQIRGVGLDNLAGMTELRPAQPRRYLPRRRRARSPAGGFPKLVDLNLTRTGVTDASIPVLKRLTGLTYLGLLGTKISYRGVAEDQKANPSLHIHAPQDNSLYGTPSSEPLLPAPVPALPRGPGPF